MKEYKKPEVEVFELRSEERIAAPSTKVKVNGALLTMFDLGETSLSETPEVPVE